MATAASAPCSAAIKRAGIDASEIDYINAHGTSTPLGDEIELGAVTRVLGDAASKAVMSSTKSAIGHLLGAAGSVEAIFSPTRHARQRRAADAQSRQPIGRNSDQPGAHKAFKKEVNVALSNSFGFGGTNATLVMRKVG
jgi:3-oxoacyl-[acyl-carrier-protein] synthase II